MERVLLYEEALAEVLLHATALDGLPRAEELSLFAAQGRILAQPIVAERDQPPFPRSTRDGFAVRAADLATANVHLRLRGIVRAGERWTGAPLQTGEAIEIMTGAPMPDGADAVLMLEHVETGAEGEVTPAEGKQLRAGENVVAAGTEARAGTELIPAGRLVATPEISLAASCGYANLQVYARPRVAIVATGDELVELGDTPEPWQIRNSNSYSLASLVAQEGAVAERLPIAKDTSEDLRARIAEALPMDLVLFSGGVSMGKYDLVEQALREARAQFFFTGARIQPGKPIVFGRLPRPGGDWTYFFGLPGNPISTEVCFRLFVTPLLRLLGGRSDALPRFGEARLAQEVPGGAKVTRFLPAITAGDWQGVTVQTVPWQGSGDLAANGRANCFVVLPLGVHQFRAGETVRVLLR